MGENLTENSNKSCSTYLPGKNSNKQSRATISRIIEEDSSMDNSEKIHQNSMLQKHCVPSGQQHALFRDVFLGGAATCVLFNSTPTLSNFSSTNNSNAVITEPLFSFWILSKLGPKKFVLSWLLTKKNWKLSCIIWPRSCASELQLKGIYKLKLSLCLNSQIDSNNCSMCKK